MVTMTINELNIKLECLIKELENFNNEYIRQDRNRALRLMEEYKKKGRFEMVERIQKVLNE